MKRLLPLFLLVGLGVVLIALMASRQRVGHLTRELEAQRVAWEDEKADLETALERALARRPTPSQAPITITQTAAAPAPDPQALLSQLAALSPPTGPTRGMRHILSLLDQLAEAGPPALPVIRQFLASGQDVTYAPLGGKGPRDIKSLTDALVPPSLRFGLFDVVRQIGGEVAEQLLAETLGGTTRSLEVAYLTQVLEETAPGRHKDTALTAARALLSSGGGTNRLDRDCLFDVLQRFRDTSYVDTAKAELVQANGQVDQSALRYLQQTVGDQCVAIAARAYQDGRLTQPGSKEPLARLALAYVGANPQAAELFHTAALDPSLTPDQKRNLVEDLNQDGLINRKTPTPEDVPIIAARYALTQAYLQQDYVQNDKLLDAAFREADKDLRNLLEKAAAAAAAAGNPGAAPVATGVPPR